MEVDSEKDYVIVYGVVGHTEFRYDGVCSESVLGDFPETIVGNCVLLQRHTSALARPIQNLSIPPTLNPACGKLCVELHNVILSIQQSERAMIS